MASVMHGPNRACAQVPTLTKFRDFSSQILDVCFPIIIPLLISVAEIVVGLSDFVIHVPLDNRGSFDIRSEDPVRGIVALKLTQPHKSRVSHQEVSTIFLETP